MHCSRHEKGVTAFHIENIFYSRQGYYKFVVSKEVQQVEINRFCHQWKCKIRTLRISLCIKDWSKNKEERVGDDKLRKRKKID